MGLFDRLKKAKETLVDTPKSVNVTPTSYNSPDNDGSLITPSLFGERQYRTEPKTVDWSDDPSPSKESDSSSIKDLASQISKMIRLGDSNSEYDDDEQNNNGLFSEKYLKNVAKLRLSQLKIKYNLKVSLLKMAFGKMLEVVGKNEQAKNVWDTQVTLSNMDDVIEEIIYLDLKHQNKMGKLKPMTPDEYFSGMFTTAIETMGGEGFNNYIELASGGFEKTKELMKPKQAQLPQ